HLETYGMAGARLGEAATVQAPFLEGLLPLLETPYFLPSIELGNGCAADLHFQDESGTVWVILLDVSAERDATRRIQQRAYDMTLLQQREAQFNRQLKAANAALLKTQCELEASRAALLEAHETVKAQAAELAAWNQTLEARIAAQLGELDRMARLKR